jgi:hypothetical protein
MLEHAQDLTRDFFSSYLDIAGKRHLELYHLFFAHGVDTLLTPVFGADLLERGESYVEKIGAQGLERLAAHPDFLEFYQTAKVRVRFYGDYRRYLDGTPYAYLLDRFDQVTEMTKDHDRSRLFFGVFAHDASRRIAELSVDYYMKHKAIPEKRELVALYYGEYVTPVDFFIGFDKFSAFDMPLVATGNEDLYFTVAPSPYLTARQLRAVLYDHLYTRREEETDYADVNSEGWALMRTFYHVNQDKTLGVGARQEIGNFWYPLPQVELPDGFED